MVFTFNDTGQLYIMFSTYIVLKHDYITHVPWLILNSSLKMEIMNI